MTSEAHHRYAQKIGALSQELEELAGLLESQDGVEGSEAPLRALQEAVSASRKALEDVADLLTPAPEGNDRILVVDDDPVSLDVLSSFLRRYGEVTTATNGSEALATVTKAIRAGKHFGFVFLDVMMPEMDGHEVLKRIRGLEEVYSAPVPATVAMTTALGDRGTVLRARHEGSGGYFVKPVDLEKLGSWVEGKGLSRGP
jgi:two-component system chemotaxis response regulator CheY